MAFQVETSLLMWWLFLKVDLLVQSCLYHFCQQKRVIAQKCSREMGNFWSTCLKASIRVISEYHDLRDLCFWSSKGFWQVWSCSKSWCIPNYQLSVSFKNSSFFVAWFPKNSRNKFLNQEFYGQMPEQAWSNGLFNFSKIVLLRAPRSLIQMVLKWKGVFIEMGLLSTVITNSFKIQNQTFKKHFHFFALTLWSWNLFLFRNISEIHNDKGIWNTSAHVDIKAVFTFLEKHIHE